jgi:hypothetical protein
MTIPAYPKVWALGHRQASGIFSPPGPIIVQEKVDGSQISFGMIDGELHMRSKSKAIDVMAPDKLFIQAVKQVVMRQEILHEGWVYRGEYLNRPKHNVLAYDRVPVGNISLYDIEDGPRFLTPEELFEEAARIEMESSYLISKNATGNVADHFQEWLTYTSKLGGQKIEGVVLKNYSVLSGFGDPLFCKYVSEEFKETAKGVWHTTPKQEFIEQVGAQFHTTARFDKAYIHLQERGEITGELKDITSLFQEVARDFEEEYTDEVKDKLWEHFRKKILKSVQFGIPQWYKDKLAQWSEIMAKPMSDERLDIEDVKRGAKSLRRQADKRKNIVPFAGDAIAEIALVYEGYLDQQQEIRRLRDDRDKLFERGQEEQERAERAEAEVERLKGKKEMLLKANHGLGRDYEKLRLSHKELKEKLAAHEEAMRAAVWALNNCKKKSVKIYAAIGLLRAQLEEK